MRAVTGTWKRVANDMGTPHMWHFYARKVARDESKNLAGHKTESHGNICGVFCKT